jgi:hypothetical protein
MQSSEFEIYFKHFPYLNERFSGVFSIDTVPKKLKNRHFCIVNTDVASENGSHWFAIICHNKSLYELFDSLSINSEKETKLKKFLKFNTNFLEVNETQFQLNESILCGNFCVYYLIQRMYNLDLDYCDFLCETFDSDLSKNELLVTKFCADVLDDRY